MALQMCAGLMQSSGKWLHREESISVMKKFMDRMAQIAYSVNMVNGFDSEVEIFACVSNH